MPDSGSEAGRWEVSTRRAGEVLTASAGGTDLALTLIGVPEGFTPTEISGWLEDVVGVARETSRADAAAKPIPHLLHHALTGLVFSQGELWSQTPGTPPCTLAFVRAESEIGFGWVGEAEVTVWLDGHPIDVQWVQVRDQDGHAARAWSVDPAHVVHLRVRWGAPPADPESPAIEIVARWSAEPPPAPAPEPTARVAEESLAPAESVDEFAPDWEESASAPEPVAAAEWEAGPESDAPPGYELEESAPGYAYAEAPELGEEVPLEQEPPFGEETAVTHDAVAQLEAASSATTDTPSSGVARWLMHKVPWLKRPAPRSETPIEAGAVAEPGQPSIGPPLSESIPVTREIVPMSSAIERATIDTPIDVGPTPSRSGFPEAIPPTPEPAELTQRALHTFEVSDPRSISLPTAPGGPRAGAPPRMPLAGVPFEVDSIAETPAPPRAASSTVPAPPIGRPPVAAPIPDARSIAPPPPSLRPPASAAPAALPAAPRAPVARPAAPPQAAPPAHAPQPAAAHATAAPPGFETGKIEVRDKARRAPPATPAAAAPHAAAPAEAAPEVEAPWLEPEPAAPALAAAGAAAASEDDPRITFDHDPHPDEWPPSRRSAWPSSDHMEDGAPPLWKRPWAWGAGVVVLVALAWLFGAMPGSRSKHGTTGSSAAALRTVSGPRFKLAVESDPAGAMIAVDGTDLDQHTPATVELPPGDHQVTLSMPSLGQATYPVTGKKGEQVPLQVKLRSALDVISPDARAVISVAVDGETKGFAPLHLDDLTPGIHEVRFSGPGIASWGQTIELKIGETQQVLTRALESPATGLIEIRATIADDQGNSAPVKGGQVWIDGTLRGGAPQTLELARGPHSIRMAYRDQEAPIQLIDLPGGNQRFAAFEFGPALEGDRPRIVIAGAVRVPADKPAVVSATFENTSPSEVREMWVHVRSADGAWRRLQMTLLSTQGTVVGVSPFPGNLLDDDGRATFYVSGLVSQGDEYFTELLTAQAEKPKGR